MGVGALQGIASFIGVVVTDEKVIQDALESSFTDFEDAIQNFTASAGGIKILLTRNSRDYKNSKLAIMTAHAYLKVLAPKKIARPLSRSGFTN